MGWGDLRGRDFLSLKDFTRDEVLSILDIARELKLMVQRNEPHELLKGKTLAMIFERPSTRTRVSFETAMTQLGGHAQYLTMEAIHYGQKFQEKKSPLGFEPLKDTYRVLAQMVDAICHRAYDHSEVVEAASLINIPVINAADNYEHPCQVMANLLTIREKKGAIEGLKLAYNGLPSECHSFMWSAAKLGMSMGIVLPENYDWLIDKTTLKETREIGKETGSDIEIVHDLYKAVEDADVVYCSGAPWLFLPLEEREKVIDGWISQYTVTMDVMKHAKPNAVFMHSMPASRKPYSDRDEGGCTDEVFESSQSVSIELAGNRLHAQKAILASII